MKKIIVLFTLFILLNSNVLAAFEVWAASGYISRVRQTHNTWCVHACNEMLNKAESQKESFIKFMTMNMSSPRQEEVAQRLRDDSDFFNSALSSDRGVTMSEIKKLSNYGATRFIENSFHALRPYNAPSLPTMGVMWIGGSEHSRPDQGHAVVITRVQHEYYSDRSSHILDIINPWLGRYELLSFTSNTASFTILSYH